MMEMIHHVGPRNLWDRVAHPHRWRPIVYTFYIGPASWRSIPTIRGMVGLGGVTAVGCTLCTRVRVTTRDKTE